MSRQSPSPESTFGYLSVLETAEHGYFGGYLIVSQLGRPMEFHCTAPVLPSRAQQILYGPTLQPYLLGELMAGTLIEAAKLTPHLILVDREAVLQAQSQTVAPLVYLCAKRDCSFDVEGARPSTKTLGASTSSLTHDGGPAYGMFTVDRYELRLAAGYESEQGTIAELLKKLARQVDLSEPFGRIEEAIREAQRLGGRGSEIHDQAA